MRNLGTLFGITLIAAAVVITAWSVEPTVGKTPTVFARPSLYDGHRDQLATRSSLRSRFHFSRSAITISVSTTCCGGSRVVGHFIHPCCRLLASPNMPAKESEGVST